MSHKELVLACDVRMQAQNLQHDKGELVVGDTAIPFTLRSFTERGCSLRNLNRVSKIAVNNYHNLNKNGSDVCVIITGYNTQDKFYLYITKAEVSNLFTAVVRQAFE